MNNLTIECVWCPSRREFNKFIKDIDRLSTKVIDHASIKNKLIKADPYGQEPCDSVVGLTIISEITRQLHIDNIGVDRVIYLFKNLEFEVVTNFKNLIDSQSDREHIIILTIIHNNVQVDGRISDLFDTVNIIKK
jgi:archaellum biogenesis ATPase FlaH